MQSYLEQLRYHAASAGKTPQEIQVMEETLIVSANTLGVSVETLARPVLCLFEVDAMSTLRKSADGMLNILRESVIQEKEQ